MKCKKKKKLKKLQTKVEIRDLYIPKDIII